MYILALLAVIVSAAFMVICSSAGAGTILSCLDLPSLLFLLSITIPILASAHLLRDFNNAWKIVLTRQKDFDLIEIKRAREAVALARRTLLCAGIFIAFFGVIIILKNVSDMAMLGPNIAVDVLSLIYASALSILLLPLEAQLKIKEIEYMQ